jgi:hypothetical protein
LDVVEGGDHYRDTWEWDGQAWSLAATDGPVQAGPMLFDAARGVMVMTSGTAGTWEWDGTSWSELAGAGVGVASVLDATAGALVHFGKPVYMMSNCAPDDDLDHVRDAEDNCEHSDIDNVLIIGRCATATANVTLEDGCTMNDIMAECAEAEPREFGFRRCVREWGRKWLNEGLIEEDELRDIMGCTRRPRAPSRLNEQTK